jgi:hypothetical protein
MESYSPTRNSRLPSLVVAVPSSLRTTRPLRTTDTMGPTDRRAGGHSRSTRHVQRIPPSVWVIIHSSTDLDRVRLLFSFHIRFPTAISLPISACAHASGFRTTYKTDADSFPHALYAPLTVILLVIYNKLSLLTKYSIRSMNKDFDLGFWYQCTISALPICQRSYPKALPSL